MLHFLICYLTGKGEVWGCVRGLCDSSALGFFHLIFIHINCWFLYMNTFIQSH